MQRPTARRAHTPRVAARRAVNVLRGLSITTPMRRLRASRVAWARSARWDRRSVFGVRVVGLMRTSIPRQRVCRVYSAGIRQGARHHALRALLGQRIWTAIRRRSARCVMRALTRLSAGRCVSCVWLGGRTWTGVRLRLVSCAHLGGMRVLVSRLAVCVWRGRLTMIATRRHRVYRVVWVNTVRLGALHVSIAMQARRTTTMIHRRGVWAAPQVSIRLARRPHARTVWLVGRTWMMMRVRAARRAGSGIIRWRGRRYAVSVVRTRWMATRMRRRRVWIAWLGMCRWPGRQCAVRVRLGNATTTRRRV